MSSQQDRASLMAILQEQLNRLADEPLAPLTTPTPAPVYSCGLKDQQRVTGSLCGKAHCIGCAPYRQVRTTDGVQRQVAPEPTSVVFQQGAGPSTYVSRTEHELALARAVREQRMVQLVAGALAAGLEPDEAVTRGAATFALLEKAGWIVR